MTTALRYTVLEGDTLSKIADGINAAAGVSYQEIEKANSDVAATGLQVGMVLNIPKKDGSGVAIRYTVMSGDSYWQISEGFKNAAGITYEQIEGANPSVDPADLKIGSVLDIPVPGSKPEPAPEPVPVVDAANIGYWYKTWGGIPSLPANCNLGLGFSGEMDVEKVLSSCKNIYADLPNVKYITFGGGTEPGKFTAAGLQGINQAIKNGKLSDYKGIAYDVELGDSGLEDAFAESFRMAKEHGFTILVTVSHSAPCEVRDSKELMESFFANEDIDMLSPQLYSNGEETQNEYATTWGVDITWEMYANAKAKIVPSIVRAAYYADAVDYFSKLDITLDGFVQWA
jgi:LysM repeat protein